MREKFGVTIIKRSFRDLGARARAIPDAEAEAAARKDAVPAKGVEGKPLNSAVKLYLAIKGDLDADPSIRGAGINCLNESHFSDTTPCLAWDRLYRERRLIWGCEADTVSMLTKHILHHALGTPIMMTNIYPFVLGDAALKHERIDQFPAVPDDPANYVLFAHCGYFGLMPQPFASEWTLRKKVLGIVDENATVIDARFPTGGITLAKLDPDFQTLCVAQGELTGYAQYPNSDCRNGGIVRVQDGHRLMSRLASHHLLLMTGRHLADMRMVAKVFGWGIQEL